MSKLFVGRKWNFKNCLEAKVKRKKKYQVSTDIQN